MWLAIVFVVYLVVLAAIGIVWVVLAMSGAVFVGLVGRAMLGPLPDADHVMPSLAVRLMHPAVAGVMIAGAVAAIMSTVDSQLLVAASAVEEDIYIRLLGGRPRDRSAVWIGRITVLVLGAVGLVIAQFWGVVKPAFGGDLLFANGLIPGFGLNMVLAYVVSLLTGGSAVSEVPAS